MQPKKGTGLLKQNSRAKIAICVRLNGPLSKAQIAKMTGLSITCVCETCNDLIREEILIESCTVMGPKGRPMALVSINPGGKLVAGVRLAPHSVEIAVARPNLEILARRVVMYPADNDVEAAVDVIAKGVQACAAVAGSDVSELSGVGVSVHGMVDPALGVIEAMTNRPGWENVPLVNMLEERLKIPVVADNCVRAGAITYQWFSAERRPSGTLFIVIAEGVGAALLYGHEIAQGILHSGVLLGHVIVDRSGPECTCGNRGCLESLTSDMVFVRELWPEAMKKASDMTCEEREGFVRRAFQLAQSGDEKASRVLDDVIECLGIGVANGILLFGPRTVILSGTLIDLAPSYIIEEIRKAALRYVHDHDRGVEIRAANNYKELLLRGAIGLVLSLPFRELREESMSLGKWQLSGLSS